MMKSIAESVAAIKHNVTEFKNETKASIHNLENQLGQIAIAVSKLETKVFGASTVSSPPSSHN